MTSNKSNHNDSIPSFTESNTASRDNKNKLNKNKIFKQETSAELSRKFNEKLNEKKLMEAIQKKRFDYSTIDKVNEEYISSILEKSNYTFKIDDLENIINYLNCDDPDKIIIGLQGISELFKEKGAQIIDNYIDDNIIERINNLILFKDSPPIQILALIFISHYVTIIDIQLFLKWFDIINTLEESLKNNIKTIKYIGIKDRKSVV